MSIDHFGTIFDINQYAVDKLWPVEGVGVDRWNENDCGPKIMFREWFLTSHSLCV